MVSKKLIAAVRLHPTLRQYQVAHAVGIHPSVLSSILCGIERVEFGDPRVLRLGRLLRIPREELFEVQPTSSSMLSWRGRRLRCARCQKWLRRGWGGWDGKRRYWCEPCADTISLETNKHSRRTCKTSPQLTLT